MRKILLLALALTIGVMAAAAFHTPQASAAGGWSAAFEATGWVSSIDPASGDGHSPSSSATFDTDGQVVTGVHIVATDQEITGGIARIDYCKPAPCDDPDKVKLSDASLIAIGSYEFDVTAADVKTVEYTMPGGSLHVAEVVFGDLTGAVGGGFTVGDGPGKTAGQLTIELTGTGGFACFAPTPGLLAPCMAGEGQMLPVEADFLATGEYAIDITSIVGLLDGDTVYEIGDLVVDMELDVDLDKLAHDDPYAVTASGSITVTDTFISYE